MMLEAGAPRRHAPCYCGGTIMEVFQRTKIVYFGVRRYIYKKPRWQIVNCFPSDSAMLREKK